MDKLTEIQANVLRQAMLDGLVLVPEFPNIPNRWWMREDIYKALPRCSICALEDAIHRRIDAFAGTGVFKRDCILEMAHSGLLYINASATKAAITAKGRKAVERYRAGGGFIWKIGLEV